MEEYNVMFVWNKRKYRENHREQLRQKACEYYEANKEKKKAYQKEYRNGQNNNTTKLAKCKAIWGVSEEGGDVGKSNREKTIEPRRLNVVKENLL